MVLLEDSTAIITGAASGIGKSISKAFVSKGIDVALIDINKDGLKKLETNLDESRGEYILIDADVVENQDVREAIDETIDHFGEIDILCNNAGIFDDFRSLEQTKESDWERVMNINLKGPFLFSKHTKDSLISEEQESVILNIASVAGKIAGGGGIAYTASKHGVVGMTKHLANRYGPEIRVNAICPGFIETGMTKDILNDKSVQNDRFVNNLPAQQLGRPEEVARLATFIVSNEATYIHGATLEIDGGWSITQV